MPCSVCWLSLLWRHLQFESKNTRYVPILAFIFLALSTTGLGNAQTARWTGVEGLVAGNGLSTPHGVAVDLQGNIYIADLGNNRILKETPSNGSYDETVVASTGLHNPAAVAVDASGSVYIADSGNNRILKESISNGAYSESVVPTTGLSSPLGIAIDASGNLYITDSGNARVLKETWNGSTYSQSFVLSGPTWPDGIAVDSSGNIYICAPFDGYVTKMTPQANGYSETYRWWGMSQAHGVVVDTDSNVYIAESGTGRILKETPSGNTYTQTILLSGLTLPQAIATDAIGTLYFNDPQNGKILKLSTSPVNFGSVEVANSTSSLSLTFVIDTPGTVGTPSVVTRGIAGMDFTEPGTGTCTSNGTSHSYAAGDACTVDVVFTPKAPGSRFGAALLNNNSGNVIATAYVQGTGIGSELRFPPGTISALSFANLNGPLAIAWDEANIYSTQTYAAYDPRNSIVKEAWNGNNYTQSTIAANLAYPTALAVDGAGNLYVSDQDNFAVYKFTPTSGGSYTKTTVDNTLGTVAGLAVDGAGNVYIGRGGIGVEKETLSGGSYLRSQIFYGFYGQSIAVDGSGVIYIADGGDLRKETPTASGYSESILASGGVRDVKVDSVGNVYYLTFGATQITKLAWTGSGYVQIYIDTGQANIADLSTDSSGNLLFSTYDSNRVGSIFMRRTVDAPFLSFATTPYESTSSDSPKTVTVLNIGNKALTLPLPTSGSNPSITPGFTLASSGASECPSVDANSTSPGVLEAGQSCQFAINFVPLSVGPIDGFLTITSDSVNVSSPANAIHNIHVHGTGIQAVPSISWSSPSAITYGTPLSSVQLNATASVPGTFSYLPAVQTVLEAGLHTLSVSFKPDDQIDYATASLSVTINVDPATPTITWPAPAAITYGTALSSIQLNATASVPGTLTYSPANGAILNAGTQTVKVTFVPTDSKNFAQAEASSTLLVNPALPSITLSSSAARAFLSNPVTLTATVGYSYGAPTGNVTFMDGTARLGTGTLNAGIATLTSSSLPVGSHVITALYSGDNNFHETTSAAFTETIVDFTIGANSGSSTSATTSKGATASYNLAVLPTDGQTTADEITLSVSGLPTGATATFEPAMVPKNSGATNLKLSVLVPVSAVAQTFGGRSGLGAPFLLAFMLLPILGTRRIRRAIGSNLLLGLLLFAGILAGTAMTACGGGGAGSNSGGTSAPQPRSYTLTVTAKAGTLTHTTNLSLTVQ